MSNIILPFGFSCRHLHQRVSICIGVGTICVGIHISTVIVGVGVSVIRIGIYSV